MSHNGLTDKEREIFQDLENELHIKYLVTLVGEKIILLSVDPTKLSDTGCPEAKVYELIFYEKERCDKDGSFLKLKNISSKPLNWFEIHQKISTDRNFKAQMESTVKACNILLKHHSPPSSPREENTEEYYLGPPQR